MPALDFRIACFREERAEMSWIRLWKSIKPSLDATRWLSAATAFFAATAMILEGQTLTTLASFSGPNGSEPASSLVQGADGNFYGTTTLGGTYNIGAIFRMSPTGTLTTLHSFGSYPGDPDGQPNGLILGRDGNFYGTAVFAGATGTGSIFKITPSGEFTTLYSFSANNNFNTDGVGPVGLIQARDGNFYGTASGAGANSYGTVFKFSPEGAFTTLYSFSGMNGDGQQPSSGLVQGIDGNYYGTTLLGGAYQEGVIFRITPTGTLTVLYGFGSTLADQGAPLGGLIQASDGNFYGTTNPDSDGTVFRITPSGTLTTIHTFGSSPDDGAEPFGGLIQATDGNLYGTTSSGGANGSGTVFRITLHGDFTILYSFTNASDGQFPAGGLIQASDDNLYGTTRYNGGFSSGYPLGGTVFRLSVGLAPLPPTISASGIVNGASFVGGGIVPGEIATVFGTHLTSATGINLTASLPLPTSFLNNTVVINNQPVPLFAVDNVSGQQQINFQVPWEVASAPKATLAVENNGVVSASISLPVLQAHPGIFNYTVGADTFGAILHANFQLADTGHPAKSGETVLIYCTGLGAVSSPPADGAAGSGQPTTTTPTVTIGGAKAIVGFSGLAPGFAGLYQINVEVPELSSGNQPVVVMLAGASSNSVLLPMQ